jgi:hypothetical protein
VLAETLAKDEVKNEANSSALKTKTRSMMNSSSGFFIVGMRPKSTSRRSFRGTKLDAIEPADAGFQKVATKNGEDQGCKSCRRNGRR